MPVICVKGFTELSVLIFTIAQQGGFSLFQFIDEVMETQCEISFHSHIALWLVAELGLGPSPSLMPTLCLTARCLGLEFKVEKTGHSSYMK